MRVFGRNGRNRLFSIQVQFAEVDLQVRFMADVVWYFDKIMCQRICLEAWKIALRDNAWLGWLNVAPID